MMTSQNSIAADDKDDDRNKTHRALNKQANYLECLITLPSFLIVFLKKNSLF